VTNPKVLSKEAVPPELQTVWLDVNQYVPEVGEIVLARYTSAKEVFLPSMSNNCLMGKIGFFRWDNGVWRDDYGPVDVDDEYMIRITHWFRHVKSSNFDGGKYYIAIPNGNDLCQNHDICQDRMDDWCTEIGRIDASTHWFCEVPEHILYDRT
jgi:hypothetical protein